MPQQIELDGQIHEFPDDFTEADIQQALMAAPAEAAPAPDSKWATALTGAPRMVPAMVRGAGRFAANHPAGVQKAISAGMSTATGAVGAGIGGAIAGPVGATGGAIVGASLRGMTPTQATIRTMAGQMAGESKPVAQAAGKALGIQNYAKELGTKVNPADIINKPNAANAIEHYANSAEKGILRLYGPSGEVVSGPSAVSRIPQPTAPSMLARGGRMLSNGLARVSGGAAIGDLAQTAEPNRRDIGFFGLGAPQPDPTGSELSQIEATNQQSQQKVMQQQAQLRARILAMFGQ